jgi:CRISPR-associated protein Csx16
MRLLLVTRHPGAVAWARARGLAFAHVPHLEPGDLRSGDTVLGSLPPRLAAAVGEAGGRFVALELDLPAGLRGRGLDAAAMARRDARAVAYSVLRLGPVAPEDLPILPHSGTVGGTR